MKKRFACLALALALMMGCMPTGYAEDMGVQVIGGPTVETEPVSLDDIKLNVDVTIDGYAIFNFSECSFVDEIGYYGEGETKIVNHGDRSLPSGNDAEFLLLRADITNLAMTSKNFLQNCEVVVVFDDEYKYAGWLRQYNYNNGVDTWYDRGPKGSVGQQNYKWVIDPVDEFPIDPMYQGHYCFGCTLPNAVVDSKKPLRMEITIDGNEITYNIRK